MSIKNILITGARAPASLYLVRCLAKAGYRVFTADCVDFNISKFSKYSLGCSKTACPDTDIKAFADDLTNIVKKNGIDLIFPTCEEIFYISKVEKQLSDYCEIFAPKYEKLCELHNKWSFSSRKFDKAATPKSYFIKNPNDISKIIKANQKKYILKPVYSRFSSNIKILDENTAVDKIELKNGDYILQEFIEGDIFCSYSVCKNGNVLLYSDYSPRYFADKGAAVFFEFSNNEKIFDFVCSFAKKENFSGQIAFDFIENKNGLYVLECNPRLTSGIQLFKSDDFEGIFDANESEAVLKPALSAKSELFFAMLLYGLQQVKGISGLKKYLSDIFCAKDAIYDSKDLKPFFMQPYVFCSLAACAIRHGISLKDAAMLGIKFDG